jgi:four helix bundle protein
MFNVQWQILRTTCMFDRASFMVTEQNRIESQWNSACTDVEMAPTHDIQARTFQLACRIIEFCRTLARSDYVIHRLASQLLHAGTSIGANLEEADSGQTKRDFIAKAAIARKESAETRYWLRLIAFAQPTVTPKAAPLIEESHQILKNSDKDNQECRIEPRPRNSRH